jgi:biopolymer transport protein TolR
MALTTGGSRGLSSDINVTPMIDILLVLLIIFMAVTPVMPKGLEALVPLPDQNSSQPDAAIVLQIRHTNTGQPAYKINDAKVAKSELAGRLQTIFSARATKVMFIEADKDMEFGPIANGIDIAKGAGVDHVGLITPSIAAGR